MVPQLGEILQGIDYDLVIGERGIHGSTISRLPIDDPNKSFVNDNNRDEPVRFDLTIVVSTHGINEQPTANFALDRMSVLYDKLLLLKREQVVDPSKLLDVSTGVIVHPNMAIANIEPVRNKRRSQGMDFNLSLEEMRFATRPVKVEAIPIPLAAGNGAVTADNKRVATEQDRIVTEGTQTNTAGTGGAVSEQDQSILFGVFN